MAIRCLAGDLLVEESLLVEIIRDSAELNHAMHGVINKTVSYEELLELVSEHV